MSLNRIREDVERIEVEMQRWRTNLTTLSLTVDRLSDWAWRLADIRDREVDSQSIGSDSTALSPSVPTS